MLYPISPQLHPQVGWYERLVLRDSDTSKQSWAAVRVGVFK